MKHKDIHSHEISEGVRIGEYRVTFDHDNEKIIILRIGHRKEIYK